MALVTTRVAREGLAAATGARVDTRFATCIFVLFLVGTGARSGRCGRAGGLQVTSGVQ